MLEVTQSPVPQLPSPQQKEKKSFLQTKRYDEIPWLEARKKKIRLEKKVPNIISKGGNQWKNPVRGTTDL